MNYGLTVYFKDGTHKTFLCREDTAEAAKEMFADIWTAFYGDSTWIRIRHVAISLDNVSNICATYWNGSIRTHLDEDMVV